MYYKGTWLCMGQYFSFWGSWHSQWYFDILIFWSEINGLLASFRCSKVHRLHIFVPSLSTSPNFRPTFLQRRRRRISGCCWSPWTPWIPTLVPSLPCRIAMLLVSQYGGQRLVFDGFLRHRRHRWNPYHPSHQTISVLKPIVTWGIPILGNQRIET